MDTVKLSLIWAMTRNRVIGIDNRLPWNLPDEMAHFRQTTRGKPVIMGRNTYESVGHPLPGRLNVVVSSKLKSLEGCQLATGLPDAIDIAKEHANSNNLSEIFVIGGARVYEDAIPWADRLYATTIDVELEGHTFLPPYDVDDWELVQRTCHGVDKLHAYAFTIEVFDRKLFDL